MTAPAASAMFDAEVIEELRRQFTAADANGDGEIDAREACRLFARSCSPDATEAEVGRTAESLRNQLDVDRSGTISFDEYCFRFGRRYQVELNRRKRAAREAVGAAPRARAASNSGAAAATEDVGDEPDVDTKKQQQKKKLEEWKLRTEQEELEKEREALRLEREELQRERERVDAERRRSSEHQGSGTGGGLAAGARVKLQGLQGAAELNGRAATVLRFEAASCRYVVELDGSREQKSLRASCLAPLGGGPGAQASKGGGAAAGPSLVERVQAAARKAFVQVQVWVAGSGYEWWQILLGAAVVLLVAVAWAQNSAKYSADVGRPRTSRTFADTSAGGRGAYDSPSGLGGDRGPGAPRHDDAWDDRAQDHSRYDDDERRRHGDQREGRRQPRRGGYDRDYDRRDYSPYDYDGGYGHSGEGEVLGGMLNGFGLSRASQTYIVVAVIGVLCWKGIIPVHRMGWWQLYMLWNMFSPFLLGSRRRGGMGYGMGYGGFGGGMMGRRGFF